MWVPDQNGYFQYINISIYVNGLDLDFDAQRDVTFLLYTRKNPAGEKIVGDFDILDASSFNASLPTRFIIHGWLNDYSFPINTEITAGYLKNGEFNVVSYIFPFLKVCNLQC